MVRQPLPENTTVRVLYKPVSSGVSGGLIDKNGTVAGSWCTPIGGMVMIDSVTGEVLEIGQHTRPLADTGGILKMNSFILFKDLARYFPAISFRRPG
jgi:hypothetical protein